MPSNVLLIPGTSGNKLMLDTGSGAPLDIGWPGALTGQAWLSGDGAFDKLTAKLGFSTESITQTLSMEFTDGSIAPVRSSLRANASIAPGPVIHAAYNQFQDAQVFAFDWRSDIRASAQQLVAFLQQTPAGSRWKVVTHSQGGLVLVIAAKMLGQRGGLYDTKALSRYVSHVALCACPLYGTVNAADALANGNNLSTRFHDSFRKISRTWPALYQMLPSWPGSVELPQSSATLLDDIAWEQMNVDPALLQRARDTRRQYLRFPLMFFSGVKVRLTMSKALMTHDRMTKVRDRMTAAGSEPGDTLVPYYTTRKQMNDVDRQACYALGTRNDTAEHFMLMNDPAIASDVRSLFAQ
jgi:hypothetical protein